MFKQIEKLKGILAHFLSYAIVTWERLAKLLNVPELLPIRC